MARFQPQVVMCSSVGIPTTALRLALVPLMPATPLLVTPVSSLPTTPRATCSSKVAQLTLLSASPTRTNLVLVLVPSTSQVTSSLLLTQTPDSFTFSSPSLEGLFFWPFLFTPIIFFFSNLSFPYQIIQIPPSNLLM